MTKRLSQDDRRAVDLLLDRTRVSAVAGNGNGGYVSHTPAVAQERIRAVEQVLKTLDDLPVAEPSDDLLTRTLNLIEGRTGMAMPAVVPGPAVTAGAAGSHA